MKYIVKAADNCYVQDAILNDTNASWNASGNYIKEAILHVAYTRLFYIRQYADMVAAFVGGTVVEVDL